MDLPSLVRSRTSADVVTKWENCRSILKAEVTLKLPIALDDLSKLCLISIGFLSPIFDQSNSVGIGRNDTNLLLPY